MSEEQEVMLPYSLKEAVQRLERQITMYGSGYEMYRPAADDTADALNGEWAWDRLLLRWLQHSTVSDNPRSLTHLHQLVADYNQANADANLTVDGLVSDGWVRIVWGTYHVPWSFIHYTREMTDQSPHLFRLLQRLHETPYPDECVIQLHDAEQQLQEHTSYYQITPGMAWFVETGIVLVNSDGEHRLNVRSDCLGTGSSSWLLSRLWTEKMAGPANADARLDWWMEYVSLLGTHFEMFRFLSPAALGELLDACSYRLLQERDITGWEEERRKQASEALSETGNLEIDGYITLIPLPQEDRELDKLLWSDRTSEAAILMQRPRERLRLLFRWIVEGEWQGGGQRDRSRLIKLLAERGNRPFLYSELRDADPSIIPVLLAIPDLTLIGLVLLARWTPSYPGHSYSQEAKEEASEVEEQVWCEVFPYVSYTMERLYSEPKKMASILMELLVWFERETRRGTTFGNSSARQSGLRRKRELLLNWLQTRLKDRDAASYEALMLTQWTDLLLTALDADPIPLEHPAFSQLLWLVQLSHIGGPVVRGEEIMACLIRSYERTHQSCRDSWTWSERIAELMSHRSWSTVFNWAMERSDSDEGAVMLEGLLRPLNLAGLVGERPEEEAQQYSWNRMVSDRIAIHLERLAGWIVDYRQLHDAVGFGRLVSAFSELLADGLKQHGDVEFRPFDTSLGYIPVWSRQVSTLIRSVSEALNVLSDEQRRQALRPLLGPNRDPGLLSHLFNRLEREKDRQAILNALSQPVPIAATVGWGREPRSIVTELLNAHNVELANLAQRYLDQFNREATARVLAEHGNWAFREQLRIHLVRREFDSIRSIVCPEDAANEFRDILTFYLALADLESSPPNLEQAIHFLEQLLRGDKGNLSYQVNLYAAYVRAAVEIGVEGGAAVEAGAEPRDSNGWKLQADRLLEQIQGMPEERRRSVDGYVNTNRLYLASMLGDTADFWQLYRGIDTHQQLLLPNGVYAVRMLIQAENWSEAEEKLEELHDWHGEFGQYEELLQNIRDRQQAAAQTIPPQRLLLELLQWPSINMAINRLVNLPPAEQVKALTGDASITVQEFILETVLDICREVMKYSPSITPSEELQAEEDRYTDLFVLLLNQRLLPLGWTAATQSRGGYTGKESGHRGGIGERDIVIHSHRRNELAIGEALNLKGLKTADIEEHTQKIFGYDTTRCYFHLVLTWGFSANPDELWTKYQSLVGGRQEGEFPVVAHGAAGEMFPNRNFQGVRSFYTSHNTDMAGSQATVIHLYVDILDAKRRKMAEFARSHKK